MRVFLALLTLPVALATASPKETKDAITTLVNDEFHKETLAVKLEWEKTNRQLEAIQNQQTRATEDSKRRGQWETEGTELLQKFQTVISSRYHDSSGEFSGGLQVSDKDVSNINKVLGRYLSVTPLKGKVSAGEAVRFLDWGAKRLSVLAKTHLEPNETNNSELEILAYQFKNSQKEQAKIMEIAKTVGLEIPGGNRSVRKAAPLLSNTPAGALLPPGAPSAEATATQNEDEPKVFRLPSSQGKKKRSLLPSHF